MNSQRVYTANPHDDLNQCRFHVSLDTTSHCNLTCRHCWMDAVRAQGYRFKNQTMDFDLFRRIVGEFRGRLRSFGMSCGYEPLINKEFGRYLLHAAEQEVPDLHFYTNGTLMTAAIADQVVAARPARVVFSLEGATPESFAEIRRGATLEKMTQAIDLLAAARRAQGTDRPALRFNWVLMDRNLSELPGLVELAQRHGVTEIFLIPHIRWTNAELQEPALSEADPARVSEALEGLRTRCRAAGILLVDEMVNLMLPTTAAPAVPGPRRANLMDTLRRVLFGRPAAAGPLPALCDQPWEMMLVTSTGTIFPCSGVLIDKVYGDFTRQSLEEIWTGPEYTALREGLKENRAPCGHCVQCPHFGHNNRREDFHRPRDFDVEGLRKILPTIVPSQNRAEIRVQDGHINTKDT
jgi:radical SAM protein with 4Fe4S-binding SPASM domain